MTMTTDNSRLFARTKAISMLACTIALTAVLSAGAQRARAQYTFKVIDAPGTTPDTNTYLAGINDSGVTVGTTDVSGQNLGFVRSASGAFTTLNAGGTHFTDASDINNLGQVVGIFDTGASIRHGFLWNAGVFTTVDVTGAKNTYARSINDSGTVVGDWQDASNVSHGFLRASNGTITTLNPFANATSFFATGINNAGQIVGTVILAGSNTDEAFVRAANGTLVTFTVPGYDDIGAEGINDLGQITGFVQNSNTGAGLGYIRDAAGNFTFFNQTTDYNFPDVSGINNHGVIVGEIDDMDAGNAHGFIASSTTAPEPGSLTLLAAVIPAALFRSRLIGRHSRRKDRLRGRSSIIGQHKVGLCCSI